MVAYLNHGLRSHTLIMAPIADPLKKVKVGKDSLIKHQCYYQLYCASVVVLYATFLTPLTQAS